MKRLKIKINPFEWDLIPYVVKEDRTFAGSKTYIRAFCFTVIIAYKPKEI